MMESTIFLLILSYATVDGYTHDLTDLYFEPTGSVFQIFHPDDFRSVGRLQLTTASNIDSYSVAAFVGNLQNNIGFSKHAVRNDESIEYSAHVFNQEVDEKSKTIHFMCRGENIQHSLTLQPGTSGSKPTSRCCVISVNSSIFQGYTSCLLEWNPNVTLALCHTSLELPSVLWKESDSSAISLSYTISKCASCSSSVHSRNCRNQIDLSTQKFKPLMSVSLSHAVSDAIREIDQNVLIQIPRGELRLNEEFIVPVRLKRIDDVLEFTVRCEIPSNSYVEFLRVLWPGEIHPQQSMLLQHQLLTRLEYPTKSPLDYGGERWSRKKRSVRKTRNALSNPTIVEYSFKPTILSPMTAAAAPPSLRTALSEAKRKQILWDVFHHSHIINPKRNVTEVVARFREDLAYTTSPEDPNDQTISAEVYKLLFRVARPPSGSVDRVAPRIFWSLTSLTRRGSFEVHVGGSQIVTRLSIESSELKHITMVIKTSALVNLAVLTGKPSLHPVWVYGLTHDHQLVDVTMRATCHTGDDAVIHFANDSCHRLGFSGAELDGSPGLPLVAKLEGRSATATLLVWYPKEPALRLQVLDTKIKQPLDVLAADRGISVGNQLAPVELKRLPTELNKHGREQLVWSLQPNDSSETRHFFQHLRICVLARFILAGSILYDKDVLGGKTDAYVDVTPYLVHRLRVDSLDASGLSAPPGLPVVRDQSSAHRSPVDLVLTGSRDSQARALPSDQLWVRGLHPGRARVLVTPVDRALVDKAIPPGLAKQLRDLVAQKQQASVNSYQPGSLPHIDFSVNDGSSVWPVGLSVKLVTDFSLEVKPTAEKPPNTSVHEWSTSHGDRSLPSGQNEAGDLLPVCAGLYTLQVTLRGTETVHAGAVRPNFDPADDRSHGTVASPDVLTRVTRGRRAATPGLASGVLVVWIHMSDGSTILWNRLLQVYQRNLLAKPSHRTSPDEAPPVWSAAAGLPFKLTVDSLRPDLFRVTNPNGPAGDGARPRADLGRYPQQGRHRRFLRPPEAVGWRRPGKRGAPRPVRSGRTRRWSPRSSYQEDESGPLVWFLKEEFSVSGSILEVGLHSPSGRLLVPTVTLQGNFHVVHDQPNQLRPLEKAESSPATVLRYNSTGRDSYHKGQGHLISTTAAEQHQLMPAEDGPRVPQLSSPWSAPQQFDRFETPSAKPSVGKQIYPLSDQITQGDERSPRQVTAGGVKGGGAGRLLEPTRDTSGDVSSNDQPAQLTPADAKSRGALELSMYILLGLFALVGLVFAVNCGAMVARYRWERVGRGTAEGITDEKNGGADVGTGAGPGAAGGAVDHGGRLEDCRGGKLEDALSPRPPRDHGSLAAAACNRWTRRITQLFGAFELTGQARNTVLLHRDNSWVWIGRSQPSDSQAAHLSQHSPPPEASAAHRQRLPHSPGCSGARHRTDNMTRDEDGRQHRPSTTGRPGMATSETTAVLSIGETDLLLMHSPYHEDGQLMSGEEISCGSREPTLGSRRLGTAGNSVQRRRKKKQSTTEPLALTSANDDCHHPVDRSRVASGESQTVGRHIHRRYTTDGLLQRNYQGQECNIRIISNPIVPRPPLTESTRLDGLPNTSSNSDEQPIAEFMSTCRAAITTVSDLQSTVDFGHSRPTTLRTQYVLANQTVSPNSQHNPTSLGYLLQSQQQPCLGTQDLVPGYPGGGWMAGTSVGDNSNHHYALQHHPRSLAPVPEPANAYRPPPPPHKKYARGRPAQIADWSCCQQQAVGGQPVHPFILASDDTADHVTQGYRWKLASGADSVTAAVAVAAATTTIASQLQPDDVHRRAGQQQYRPAFAPIRSRCQTRIYQTLDVGQRNRSNSRQDHRRPRPLSLPQDFTVPNELHAGLAEPADRPNYPVEGISCELRPSHHPANQQTPSFLKPSTSEESLWWYHPVRGRRKRCRSYTSRGQSSTGLSQQNYSVYAVNSSVFGSGMCHVVDCIGPHPQRPTQVTDEPSIRPPSLLRSSVSSELTWDRELFALSHDHLMAYFAGMKESIA